MSEAVLDQSARITRVPVPIASPGNCAICGKNEHPKGFAATDNFDFEFYGTVYFCADCVGDYARVFGYMSREEISDLIEKQKRTDEELTILRESVVNLENILDAYSKLRSGSDIPDYRSIITPLSSENVNEGTDQGTTDEFQSGEEHVSDVISIAPESIDAGEGEDDTVNESSGKQGRDDVRDAPSADVISLFDDLGI